MLRVSTALSVLLCAVPWAVRADGLASALYVRTDTDETVVVSPRARVAKRLGETELDITYAADIWTSASIDIRTSASPAVTEQRDEIDVAVSHELEDLTLTGSYRYSQENDYESHGGSVGATFEMAENNTTLAPGLSLYKDTVGQSGNPLFSRSLTTVGGSFAFTQVIDPEMLAQATYELVLLNGYQASAYRYVGYGGTGEGCQGAVMCLPEKVPDQRTRHAIALLLRRALSEDLSAQLNYRYYVDNWGLGSHTLAAQLDWFVASDTLVSLRYRFYSQGKVDFYRPIYAEDYQGDTTRDRELSSMGDHRIGVDIDQRFDLGDDDPQLVLAGGLGGDFYSYDEFIGLDSVTALEITFAVGLEQ